MRHTKAPLFLCILYLFFIGCQSTKEYSYVASDTNKFRDKKISTITMKDGSIRSYNDIGGTFYEERTDSTISRNIVGLDANNELLSVNLNNVLEVQCLTKQSDVPATVLLALAGTAVLLFVGFIVVFSNTFSPG